MAARLQVMSTPARSTSSRRVRLVAPPDGALTAALAGLALAFVLLSIGTPLLGLRVFHASDLTRSFPPWRSGVATGLAPQNPCVSDTVDGVLPSRTEAARRLRAGDYPLWNPWPSGGTSLDATTDPGSFSPVALPFLLLPPWLAPAYVKLLEMAVSIGFGTLFLRRLALSRPAALLGGLLYTSSGFLVVWTNWPQTNVAAFVPALFWAVERFAQLRTVRSAVPIALAVAAMLFGGFPAVTGYALYAAVPYLAVRLLWQERRRPLRAMAPLTTAGAAVVLGAGLTAVQLMPFLYRLQELDLGYRRMTSALHLPARALVTVAVPNAFGSCPAGNYFGPLNQVEVSAYFGSAALVLVVISLLVRRPAGIPPGVRGFMVAGTGATLVLGWVGGPALALAQRLPVFSNNYAGRIRVLLGFFLAVLAAMGYDALVRRRRPAGRPRRSGLLVGVAAWAMVAYVGYRIVRFVHAGGQSAGQSAYINRQLLWAVLAAAIAVAAVAAAAFLPRVRQVALLVLAATVTVQSLLFAQHFWPKVPRGQFYPTTAAHRFLEQNLQDDRYAADGQTLLPGTNTYYRLRSLGGHAFTEPQWKDLLTAIDPNAFLTPTYSTLHATSPIVGSPVLDALAVRYFVAAPETMPLGSVISTGRAVGGLVLRSGGALTVTMPQAPATGVRGVGVTFAKPVSVHDRFARLDVDVLGSDGSVITRGSRRIYGEAPVGTFVVAVPQPGAGTVTSAVRVTLHARGGAATLAADADGRPVGTVVRATEDRLRLVFADGATIYRRAASLPRVRWASSAVVIADPKARVAALAAGRIAPDAVVLDQPGPRADGRAATLDVQHGTADGLRARVRAEGAGYVVVADGLLNGWTATVDGKPVATRAVDHALLGVPVPAGSHEVAIRYDPRGFAAGRVITLVALGLLLALWLLPKVAARRRPPAASRRGAAIDHRPLPAAEKGGKAGRASDV